MTTHTETGAVTAEVAVALPVLVLLAALLGWFVAIGVTQARAEDAAREAVRAIARGETQDAGEALGRRIAPERAQFMVNRSADTVTVTVDAEVSSPEGILRILPGHRVHGKAVGAVEPGS